MVSGIAAEATRAFATQRRHRGPARFHHKSVTGATIPPDKKLYERQIDAADQEIETLVGELYGLTEEEIAIVEQGR